EVDVLATYQQIPGTLHAVLRKAGCEASTLSPSSLTYNAFGENGYVNITTPLSDCYWTAESDASWLKFKFDPRRSGSGSFTYFVPANSSPDARTANIVISLTGGATLTHTIVQDKPVSCSYVVNPSEATFTRAGGSGSFDVVTTPPDCRWTLQPLDVAFYGLSVTAGDHGTGAGHVTYTVAPSPSRAYQSDVVLRVQGLSG